MKTQLVVDDSTSPLETALDIISSKKGKFKEKTYGAFSRVFINRGKTRVIKLSQTVPDVGYQSYIAECLKYQTNPFVPKIYSITEVKNAFESYTITETEFLETSTNLFMFHEIYDLHSDILTHFIKIVMNGRYTDTELLSLIPALNLSYLNGLEQEFLDVCKLLHNTLKPLRQDRYWESLDLHGNNIMFRKVEKGYQLVITDPIA